MRHRTAIALAVWTLVGLATPAAAAQRTQEILVDRDVDFVAGGRLVANVGDMDIRIDTEAGSTAGITVIMEANDPQWGRDLFDQMNFEVRAEGDGLRIMAHDVRVSGAEWRRHGSTDFRLIVSLPPGSDLDLTTEDGDVEVEGRQGAAVMRTEDGDISAEQLTGSAVRLHSSDGDIAVGDLESDQIEIETSDGDVVIESLSGALHVSTSDGDLYIGIARFDGLHASSGDGDITVHADASIRASVILRGEELYVPEGFGLQGRLENGRISGDINGGGPPLEVRTGDGSIRLLEH